MTLEQLDQQIATKRTSISTDSYPMSIGELSNMYRDGEMDVHPEFQRFYRWSEDQKSRLIESLLLGIPIPSIFVAQREDGVWDVIDGLQRLSTIFQFIGILKDDEGNNVEPLITRPTDYLPALEGMTWSSISTINQLIIKRSKLDIKIMLRESDANSKYELFQRLNTGGSQLSEQETRNCIMLMHSPEFYRWVDALSKDENFRNTLSITDNSYIRRYDMELVCRFIVFRSIDNVKEEGIGNLGEFITKSIINIMKDPDYNREKEEKIFRETFKLINDSLGDRAFAKYYDESNSFKGAFSVSVYEAVTYGLGCNFEDYQEANEWPDVYQKIKDLWAESKFSGNIGSGYNASRRIGHTLPVAKVVFKI